jgi:phage gp36-like protein
VAYLTVSEVENLYPSLKELVDGERVTEEQVGAWIVEAESLINGKIGSRYQLPFSSTPPLVKTLAIEFFEYFWQKSNYTPTASGDEVPWLYARYDRLMKLLVQIGEGKLLLFDDDGVEITTASRKLGMLDSNHLEREPIFNLEDAQNQTIPSDDDYGEVD